MTDLKQFEVFMTAYQNMVYSTAVRLLGNPADAQDISQEVFLKAYERFDQIGHSPQAGGWLKTVTTNLSLNHLSRYRKRWRSFTDLAPEDDEENAFVDSLGRTEDELPGQAADQKQMLERALQKLPESQRVPLVLFHFDEMPYEEIAAKLRISLSKVKTDIHRGRETLRRVLSGLMSEDSGRTPRPRPSEGTPPSLRMAQLSTHGFFRFAS